ncbi:SAM-dependent methyltransferase [Streptomyces justiciae]|uniref:SAM-dependent methyltransferase n=1 Tax=Streptomyces justiciae TaxID=2780140 RepID=UPI0018802150|nr:class I SAM-dependent methyltransferase [Streptomyces justiciae]MBE8470399.1 class I SAM-dependent methyltransferase [Streptomyces justiciae]MCW8376631.1 class I SAM-dependent methyltransferase [Streptomyces justiciae]
MLNNLVNRHDADRLLRKVRKLELNPVLAKLRVRGGARVVQHWSQVDPSLTEWWAIPSVIKRWNLLMTGDAEVPFPQYVAAKHFAPRTDLRGLSLGCGTGGNELLWAKTGAFSLLEGVDVAPERIGFATRTAAEEGLADVLRFRVTDVNQMTADGERFDVLLGLQSLHHFDNLDETLPRLAQLIEPDGLFVIDEFVGPTRFQWTDAQLDAANALLARLPEERRRLADGRIKRRVVRPSRMSMVLDDPSEAVDAAALLPGLRREFEVVEERPYGGTVLHIAFSGIAHNFRDGAPETLELLERCFAAEDAALPEVGHDFVAMVCRRRP